jgi:MFS transporter, DHA2 family, multidrug resistance protein
VLLGISSGPSMGGWLSEYDGWRSIFYFSLPMTGFIFLAVALSLPEKKAEQNPPFDFFGERTVTPAKASVSRTLDFEMPISEQPPPKAEIRLHLKGARV